MDIRGRGAAARVVPTPFYKRKGRHDGRPALQRRATSGSRWTATSARSGSRTTPRNSSATSCIVELPEVGHVYNADDEFGTVESVKAVSELFSPVSGEVVEINKGAVSEPGIVNDDPQGDGWLIKVKLSTDEEIAKLMSAEAYAAYVREEEQAK